MNSTAFVGVPPEVLLCQAPDLHANLSPQLGPKQAQLGPNMDPLAGWIDGTTTLASATTDHTTLRWSAEQVFKSLSRRHDANASVRDRTRLACQKGPITTGWLCALPNKALRTDIPGSEFRLLLCWWLGLPILPQGTALPECPMCKDTLDPYGDHFVCCSATAAHKGTRPSGTHFSPFAHNTTWQW